MVTPSNGRLVGWGPGSLWVSHSYLPLMSFVPYAEDRTPFQFLARQMICVALPSHLSFVPYARGVHPLIFLIHHPAPPRALPYSTRNTALHLYLWRPGPQSGIYIYIYICRHVSGHVSTPGCVSRLGPERSASSLRLSFCRSIGTTQCAV